MKAKRIMNPTPMTIHADASIRELIQTFNDKRLDAICVVEGENKLVGVVTSFELFQALLPDYVKATGELAHIISEGYFEKMCNKIKDQPVSTIMRTDIIQFKEEDNLISVVADIVKYRLMVIPVLRGETLVGTIHRKGLLTYASQILFNDHGTDQ